MATQLSRLSWERFVQNSHYSYHCKKVILQRRPTCISLCFSLSSILCDMHCTVFRSAALQMRETSDSNPRSAVWQNKVYCVLFGRQYFSLVAFFVVILPFPLIHIKFFFIYTFLFISFPSFLLFLSFFCYFLVSQSIRTSHHLNVWFNIVLTFPRSIFLICFSLFSLLLNLFLTFNFNFAHLSVPFIFFKTSWQYTRKSQNKFCSYIWLACECLYEVKC
jgi:hypothetical protein